MNTVQSEQADMQSHDGRKAYSAPVLVDYGHIAEMTAGGINFVAEGMGYGMYSS